MFEGCAGFNWVPFVPTTKTQNVKSMKRLFKGCSTFNNGSIAPLHFDTGNCTDMSEMFQSASIFDTALSNTGGSNPVTFPWDTHKVLTCRSMFEGAAAFNQYIGGDFGGGAGTWFGSGSAVQDTSGMFHNALAFNNGLLPSFPFNFLYWDVANVTSMVRMFDNAESFNQFLVDPGGGVWQVENVRDMTEMFKNANPFNQNLTGWNVSNVTSMENMFKVATSFNNGGAVGVPIPLVWDTAKVTSMKEMFCRAEVFDQVIEFTNMSQVAGMEFMFNAPLCDPAGPMAYSQASYDLFVGNIVIAGINHGLVSGVQFTDTLTCPLVTVPAPGAATLTAPPYLWTVD
jgi:hypothetical protein